MQMTSDENLRAPRARMAVDEPEFAEHCPDWVASRNPAVPFVPCATCGATKNEPCRRAEIAKATEAEGG